MRSGLRPRSKPGSTISSIQARANLGRLISAKRLPAIARSDRCLVLEASSSTSPRRGSISEVTKRRELLDRVPVLVFRIATRRDLAANQARQTAALHGHCGPSRLQQVAAVLGSENLRRPFGKFQNNWTLFMPLIKVHTVGLAFVFIAAFNMGKGEERPIAILISPIALPKLLQRWRH